MRVAITTDWLVTSGGAERVICEMCKIWPDADIFTTVYDKGEMEQVLGYGARQCLQASSLQGAYSVIGNHRILLPWMPRAVESWNLNGYDVIISSSHAVAKGCVPPPDARHICYCHTPMRYAWEMEEKYLDDFRLAGPFRSFAKWQLKKIRRWDRTTAKRVDLFIANSGTTQNRIHRIYNRDSVVLHPPVNEQFFNRYPGEDQPSGNYFLSVCRLVPYKRVDLLIEAANNMGIKIKIAGCGPEEARLRKLAGKTVEFLGYVPEDELQKLYANAKALLFTAEEDAGIVPIEAQACGTPVIAFGSGGVLDTVKNGMSGILFDKQNASSLKDAIKKFDSMQFCRRKIYEHAKQFSGRVFRKKLKNLVENMVRSQHDSLSQALKA